MSVQEGSTFSHYVPAAAAVPACCYAPPELQPLAVEEAVVAVQPHRQGDMKLLYKLPCTVKTCFMTTIARPRTAVAKSTFQHALTVL